MTTLASVQDTSSTGVGYGNYEQYGNSITLPARANTSHYWRMVGAGITTATILASLHQLPAVLSTVDWMQTYEVSDVSALDIGTLGAWERMEPSEVRLPRTKSIPVTIKATKRQHAIPTLPSEDAFQLGPDDYVLPSSSRQVKATIKVRRVRHQIPQYEAD